MKYISSLNTTYRTGVGVIPTAWLETDFTDERAFIDKLIDDKIRVYDADICGDKTVDIHFDTGKSFRIEYSWYIGPDYDEMGNPCGEGKLRDTVCISEIDNSTAPAMRDWI